MSTDATGLAWRQAVEWEARLRDGQAAADAGIDNDGLRDFARWYAASASHAQAWDALQERLARLGGRTGATLSGGGPDAAMAAALRAPSEERRRALRAAFGLLVVGVGAWGARAGYHQLGLDADWRGAVGQRGRATLADGTAMAYDADSRIYLQSGTGAAGTASLHLQRGQLLLMPGALGARAPLTVATAHGVVQADGAEFTVGRLRGRSVVAVRSGSAMVRPDGHAALRLQAGQSCYFNRDGARASDLSFAAVSGWTSGVHVADRAPLAELLDVFGRYRPGMLRASDSAAARLVSGVFRLHDIDAALRQVAEALPVTVTRYGRYLTVLR